MQFLIKAALRSITVKPIRTTVIVLCLAAVSLTFSLFLTISASSKAAVEDQIRSGMGGADITVQSENGFDELPDLSANIDCLPVVIARSYFQIHDISNYKYVQKKISTFSALIPNVQQSSVFFRSVLRRKMATRKCVCFVMI